MATKKKEKELGQALLQSPPTGHNSNVYVGVEIAGLKKQIRDVNDTLKGHQTFEFKSTLDENEARSLEQDECVEGLRAECARLQEELVSTNELLGCARLLATEYMTREKIPVALIPIPEPIDQL